MPLTQEDLDRAREIAEDKEWLLEVANMIIKDQERAYRALEKEVVILRGIVSN